MISFFFLSLSKGTPKYENSWNWFRKDSQDDILWNEISLSTSDTNNILGVHCSSNKT